MEGGDLVAETFGGQGCFGQLSTPGFDGVVAGAYQIGFVGVGGQRELVAHGLEVELDVVVEGAHLDLEAPGGCSDRLDDRGLDVGQVDGAGVGELADRDTAGEGLEAGGEEDRQEARAQAVGWGGERAGELVEGLGGGTRFGEEALDVSPDSGDILLSELVGCGPAPAAVGCRAVEAGTDQHRAGDRCVGCGPAGHAEVGLAALLDDGPHTFLARVDHGPTELLANDLLVLDPRGAAEALFGQAREGFGGRDTAVDAEIAAGGPPDGALAFGAGQLVGEADEVVAGDGGKLLELALDQRVLVEERVVAEKAAEHEKLERHLADLERAPGDDDHEIRAVGRQV